MPPRHAVFVAPFLMPASALAQRLGPAERLIGSLEQLQVPLAEARAALGLPGLSVQAAHNFRDKNRMQDVLAAAGLPCVRHRLISCASDAEAFVREVPQPAGYEGAGYVIFRHPDTAIVERALRRTAEVVRVELG